MCNILKFTQNSLVVHIRYLLIYSQQFFVTTLLPHIAFMHNVFCFNGFNQAPIVLRYSAHIKPLKRLKPLNQTEREEMIRKKRRVKRRETQGWLSVVKSDVSYCALCFMAVARDVTPGRLRGL